MFKNFFDPCDFGFEKYKDISQLRNGFDLWYRVSGCRKSEWVAGVCKTVLIESEKTTYQVINLEFKNNKNYQYNSLWEVPEGRFCEIRTLAASNYGKEYIHTSWLYINDPRQSLLEKQGLINEYSVKKERIQFWLNLIALKKDVETIKKARNNIALIHAEIDNLTPYI